MPITKWTVSHVGTGTNASELMGCQIQISGNSYQLLSGGTMVVQTDPNASQLPTPPFSFPSFTSKLNGTVSTTWNITVTTLTGGKSGNKAEGTFSTSLDRFTDIDTDGWHAQADQVDDEDAEKHKEAVASASPKQ
jgi:hypothetical protein